MYGKVDRPKNRVIISCYRIARTPDIIIHDLVSFYKPEVLNQVAALEVKSNKKLYYKVR